MKIALVLLLVALSGCASMSRETKIEEGVWQTLNATDAYTTNRGLRDNPNLRENGIWKAFGGDQPSTGRIVEAAAVWGLLHLGVSAALSDSDAPAWLQRAWQFVSITNTGIIINNNRKIISDAGAQK